MMNDEQVNDFWRWFTDFREDIAAAALSGNGEWLRKELTDRVLKMQAEGARPRLNWEISPGVSKRWRLAFSPMVKRNLKLTESIVAHAPEVSDWEFLSTKPPKPDRFTYRLQDEDGEIVLINFEPCSINFADRIWSGDGQRSVRYGEHEIDSSPNLHHYHKETWYPTHVDNLVQRVQKTKIK